MNTDSLLTAGNAGVTSEVVVPLNPHAGNDDLRRGTPASIIELAPIRRRPANRLVVALRTLWLKAASLVAPDRKFVCELDDFSLEGFTTEATTFGLHRFGFVVTPNVDHLIRLHDDASFREAYGAAEYVLLDSRFLANLLRLVARVELPVCTGSDLTLRLFARTAPSDRVVIIGGSPDQIRTLSQRYHLTNVVHHNPPMGFIHDPAAVTACLQFIESHSPFRYCLLAVGSPQQEFLAHQLRARGIARGLTLCIGASIDFMTGVERRAPLWLRRCGFEWTYRLLQNPGRLAKRYLVRGPRIFWLLRKIKFVLRAEPPPAVSPARAA
jgi:N-acetylglucosaminyldiphosphoundecaprenol N-acetyl-beta-D-mannosaminyltransferase